MEERILTQLWDILPVMSIVLSIIGTTILTSVVSSFLPVTHPIFRPKIVLLLSAFVISYLVMETNGFTIRTIIFNFILTTGLSIMVYEYAGGQWLINRFLKPMVDTFAHKVTGSNNNNRGSQAVIQQKVKDSTNEL
jgi:hypothetical protein